MTEQIGSYKKVFKDGESKTLKYIMFNRGGRTIDNTEYTFETFVNSGKYNIKEVSYIPMGDRIAYLVWYTK